jgi:hypothetical protein
VRSAGEELYFQAAIPVRSAVARAALCPTLPRLLNNSAFFDCLTPLYERRLSEAQYSWMALFVGGGGMGMQLHNDRLVANVFAVQQVGRKRFVFCPQSEEEQLLQSDGIRMIDLFNASTWTDASRFEPLRCLHVELGPGDLVHWPSKWFHQSFQAERSVALSSFALDRTRFPDFLASATQYHTRLRYHLST